MKWIGLALLAMMPLHVYLRPEHGWILLAVCDVACVLVALGTVAGWHRVTAIAGLFAIAVGVPAIIVGLATTYHLNPTGIVLHAVPPVLGWITIAKHGLPERAALVAWGCYIAVFVAGFVLAPDRLNINMANHAWKPVANAVSLHVFQLGLVALVGALLFGGELVVRGLLRRRAAARVTA